METDLKKHIIILLKPLFKIWKPSFNLRDLGEDGAGGDTRSGE
jgi:hypothetical protein